MKIALIGYGKMGKLIEKLALEKGHAVVAKIETGTLINTQTIGLADVCIDFSHPESVLNNIKAIATLKKPLVVGTTGWEQYLDEVKHIVADAGIGFIHAPNFSLGVALFLKIVREAAAAIAPHREYDVAGSEIHHNQKVDRPSGTAKKLTEVLHANYPRGKEIEFASIRVGSVPGTHQVIFDSPADTITLTHTARNREGFAAGAIEAAEWILGKKGFYNLDDMLTT